MICDKNVKNRQEAIKEKQKRLSMTDVCQCTCIVASVMVIRLGMFLAGISRYSQPAILEVN